VERVLLVARHERQRLGFEYRLLVVGTGECPDGVDRVEAGESDERDLVALVVSHVGGSA
jgi:hypothetical protein